QASPSAHSSKGSTTAPDPGSIHGQLYRNRTFGFSYKIPFGWVQRTTDMRESVNSAVVVTAESLSSYPDLDRAVDYFDVLDEVTSGKSFKVLNPPYEFPVGPKKLARGDYIKPIGNDVTMYQGSLVLLEKGFV